MSRLPWSFFEISARDSANVGYGLPAASMPSVFLMLLQTASTQPWWPPSALYAMVNLPDHGEMASASAHSFFASVGLYFSTSAPVRDCEYPSMVGDVKSLAGVRVPSKMTL